MTEAKKTTAKKSRTRKASPRAKSDGKLYPDGFPQDGNVEGGEVDVGLPLDAESARLHKEHELVSKAVRRGERVKLSPDAATRYMECVKFYPQARVVIVQTHPQTDESIPSQPLGVLRTYEALKEYIRNNHWNGDQAIYRWVIRDTHNPNWAVGDIQFAPNLDVIQRKQGAPEPPPQPQQQPMNPFFPPMFPGMMPGMQPMMPGMMPGMMSQQTPPDHQQPAQPQVVMPPQPDHTGMVLQYLMQIVGGLMQQQQQQQAVPLPPQPVVEPPKPVDPLQEAGQHLKKMLGVMKMAQDFSNAVNPQSAVVAAAPEAPKSDDDFPLKVKDIGPVRMVRDEKGRPVDGATMLLMNMDKIMGGLEMGVSKVSELIEKGRAEGGSVAQIQSAEFQQRQQQIQLLQGQQEIERRRLELEQQRLVQTTAQPVPEPPPPVPEPPPPPVAEAPPPPPAPEPEPVKSALRGLPVSD